MACQSFDPFKGLHRIFRCPDCADTIKDSRDFKVLKSLNAETNAIVQKRQAETMEDEQLWLKLRYYLLRSVYLQLEFLNDPNNIMGNRADLLSELAIGKEMVETLMPKIKEAAANGDDKRYSYFEPEASPFRWSHIKFESLVALVKPLIFISDASALNSKIQEEYSANLEAIINDLEEQLSAINSLVTMKQALLSLTISVEFISLCVTSLVSMAHMTSSPTCNATDKSSGASGKQSVAQAQQQQQQVGASIKNKSIPNQLINKTEAQLTKLSNLIKNVDPKATILDRIDGLERCLLSNKEFTRLEMKSGSVLVPIMGHEVSLSLISILYVTLNHYPKLV